jgi:hypothetical protein
MAKTQSAHQTVRSLTSSIRSSTLSILFGISACPARRGVGPGEAGGQEGSTRVTGPPGEGSAAAGAVAGEEGRAGGGGDSSRRRIF